MTVDLNQRHWHTTASAAEYASCHPQTVLKALRSGELEGFQRKGKGNWRIATSALDQWIRGER